VVMVMYMKDADGAVRVILPPAAVMALAVAAAAVLVIGIYPGPFLDYAQSAVLKIH